MFRFLHFGDLTKAEQEQLLHYARECIDAGLHGQYGREFLDPSSRLMQPKGAFVTLFRNDDLRGCIGFAESEQPLFQTVQDVALAAALKDPRFPPLEQEELPKTVIEISVLSPLRPLNSINKIRPSRHGLMIQLDEAKGLLLPQVAARNHWDRLTFLENVCLKAGLSKDAWKLPAAEMTVFDAQVFSDV